jgi:hypothetical protein
MNGVFHLQRQEDVQRPLDGDRIARIKRDWS